MLDVPHWQRTLKGEVLDRAAMLAIAPAWSDLCTRVIEDNVYYSPRYAHALLSTVAAGTDVRFAVVWHEHRLVAMLPFVRPKLPVPMIRPARAWQSEYTFSCTPLLDSALAIESASALIDVMASAGTPEWVLPTLNADGEASRAIVAALERRGLSWGFSNAFQRATLRRGLSFDEHMQQHVSSKRRKDLARTRRRLEQLGEVRHVTHCSGDGLSSAVQAFLTMEASGWKGAQGTALACQDDTRRFAEEAFSGGANTSICRADVLTLNDKPVAIGLMAFAGRTGFTVKGAYDESYRNYSVGLLLELEVIRSFLSEDWASRLDSATAGAHVVDDFWPGRTDVADLLFSLSPAQPDLRLSILQGWTETKGALRTTIKDSAQRLKKILARSRSRWSPA